VASLRMMAMRLGYAARLQLVLGLTMIKCKRFYLIPLTRTPPMISPLILFNKGLLSELRNFETIRYPYCSLHWCFHCCFLNLDWKFFLNTRWIFLAHSTLSLRLSRRNMWPYWMISFSFLESIVNTVRLVSDMHFLITLTIFLVSSGLDDDDILLGL
jgi:hypothetical protein